VVGLIGIKWICFGVGSIIGASVGRRGLGFGVVIRRGWGSILTVMIVCWVLRRRQRKVCCWILRWSRSTTSLQMQRHWNQSDFYDYMILFFVVLSSTYIVYDPNYRTSLRNFRWNCFQNPIKFRFKCLSDWSVSLRLRIFQLRYFCQNPL